MADSKVSELTAATSVGGSDILYLVQSNTSKRLPVSTLFANAANTNLKGTVSLGSSSQTLTFAGGIDLGNAITVLTADASGGNITIANGSLNSVKVIVMGSTAGGSYRLKGNIAAGANILFTAAGNSATLLYTSDKWYMIGGSARLV
jgi:hypothetical protein